jgi:Calx-beta domain
VEFTTGNFSFFNGVNNDIVGTFAAPVDPKLSPLGFYGGPTQTLLPLCGSPAIDAGDDAVTGAPLNLATDQRGVARKVGSHADIGSVEFNALTDAPGGDIQFSAFNYPVPEGNSFVNITVTRTGLTTQAATVDFATADNNPSHLLPCSQVSGNASSRCDYEATSGTLQFAPGESQKMFTVLINDDSFVEGTETAKLILSNPTGDSALGPQSTATLEIDDNDSTAPTTNPIDDASFFVRQHYHDFLSREPDTSGLNFWTQGITSCGADAHCVEVKRVNTSAAFFLSIEFQNTGYYVYRVYKAAFGDINPPSVPVPVRFDNFIRGAQAVGQGVVVGQGNWQQQLAANKSAFALAFVQRSDFLAAAPTRRAPRRSWARWTRTRAACSQATRRRRSSPSLRRTLRTSPCAPTCCRRWPRTPSCSSGSSTAPSSSWNTSATSAATPTTRPMRTSPATTSGSRSSTSSAGTSSRPRWSGRSSSRRNTGRGSAPEPADCGMRISDCGLKDNSSS